jgi:hypothetical protein
MRFAITVCILQRSLDPEDRSYWHFGHWYEDCMGLFVQMAVFELGRVTLELESLNKMECNHPPR